MELGDKVILSNDAKQNNCYDSFMDKILTITHVAHDKSDHPGYDSGLSPDRLYDFKDEDGNDIPCSLYDYELESI